MYFRTSEGFRRKRKRLGVNTWSGVPLLSNDLQDYKQDMFEERIQGIEDLVGVGKQAYGEFGK